MGWGYFIVFFSIGQDDHSLIPSPRRMSVGVRSEGGAGPPTRSHSEAGEPKLYPGIYPSYLTDLLSLGLVGVVGPGTS